MQGLILIPDTVQHLAITGTILQNYWHHLMKVIQFIYLKFMKYDTTADSVRLAPKHTNK